MASTSTPASLNREDEAKLRSSVATSLEGSTCATGSDHVGVDSMGTVKMIRRSYKRLLCIALLIPAILFVGFDNIIVNGLAAMPYFDFIYGEVKLDPSAKLHVDLWIPATWLGLWHGLGYIGNICGSLLAGWIQDRFGRRSSLALASLLAAISTAVIYGSSFFVAPGGVVGHGLSDADILNKRRGVFLLGKVLSGLAAGQMATSTQTYLSEIAPQGRLRGPAFAVLPLMTLGGELLGAGILFSKIYIFGVSGFRTCMLSGFAFPGGVLIATALLPESPAWLVRVGKIETARRAERRLESSSSDADGLVDHIVQLVESEKQDSDAGDKVTTMQCFRGVDRRRTLIVILANSLTNAFGITFLASATYFFELLSMQASLAIKLLEAAIGLGMVATLISFWLTTKVRQRTLMIGSLVIVALLWLGVGIAGCFPIYDVVTYYSATSTMLVIFVAGIGVWPASVAVASITSSLRLRGRSQAVGWIWQNLLTGVLAIVLPYIYTPVDGNSQGRVTFLFFGTASIGALLVWLYVPEMRGRSQGEIDALFLEGVPARAFEKWRIEEGRVGGGEEEVIKGKFISV